MVLPLRDNRSVAILDEIMVTDRDGNEIRTLGDVLVREPNPNWDIDRAGSKGQIEIEAIAGALKPNMWIVPYRTYIPEVGDIVRIPRGHWKLGMPGVTYDGTRALDTGTPASHQVARGSDIIDDLAGVRLTETFYTPPRGHVMTDVLNLIQMGSCGAMGPNLLTNGSFENGSTGWSEAWFNGASGSSANVETMSWFNAAHGDFMWRVSFGPSMPAGAYIRRRQEVPIPSGARFMYASGLAAPLGGGRMELQMRFDAPDHVPIKTVVSPASRSTYNMWKRHMIFAEVPDGAVAVTIDARIAYHTPGPAWNESHAWDDIRAGVCTTMPIPTSRVNLPGNVILATTRIQTSVGKNLLYDAINADRCAATTHHAIHTQQNGIITTSPVRNTSNATPRRTYGPGDIRITSTVEIPPAGTDIPNRFSAIKESFEEGVAPIYVTSENNNPNDPYSIANTGQVRDAEPIMSPDAVDEAALQALADAARDRYSTQEEITFRITPDPYLDVYDVIEITDPAMPRAMGKWGIEYIGDDGPEMIIVARRAIGGW